MTDNEILACEEKLRKAQLTGDVALLDRLVDDTLMFASFDGTIVRKSDDLGFHRSGRNKITKMDVIERDVLYLGDTAVVSVLMDAAVTMDGTPSATKMRYTRVWHKRENGWRLVAGHMSPVAP